MQHELEYIEPGRDALRWALGCVSTSYAQRLASLNVVQVAVLRWVLAGFIASWAIGDLFAARFLYLKTAGWLGLRIKSASVGFISSLSTLPTWLIVVDGIGGLLYVAAACCLLWKRISTLWVLAAATATNCAACVCHILLALEHFGPRSFMDSVRHTGFTYALQVGVILLLWHGFASHRGRTGA